MAYDKVVDSSVLDAGLTSIADAIRAKTGSTEAMTIDQMATAVEGIETGGDDETLNALIDRSITEISSNITSIGDYTFNYCEALSTVDFPAATSIGSYAFANCTKLTTADFPAATSMGGSAFSGCTKLNATAFPVLTSINGYTFKSCTKLTAMDFPAATSINKYAFYGCCALTALILRGETMCTLSSTNAFTSCYHILGTTNNTYNPDGVQDGYIYVPSALMATYQAATNWSTYSTQFRALEDYTVDGTITGELDESKI